MAGPIVLCLTRTTCSSMSASNTHREEPGSNDAVCDADAIRLSLTVAGCGLELSPKHVSRISALQPQEVLDQLNWFSGDLH